MNKKYFETKTGSLEDVSTKIAIEQPTITKEEPKVKLTVDKTYFDVKPGSLADAAAKVVSEGKEIKEDCGCTCGKSPCKACGKDHHQVKEETIKEFTSQQIKQAYGILNDPRYKQGNYTGAVKAIEKLAKGLSTHKDVWAEWNKRNHGDLEFISKTKGSFDDKYFIQIGRAHV